MNLKACTFETLAFISLGFASDAQIGKTFGSGIYYGSSVDVGRIHFLFGTLQALGSHHIPRYLEEDHAIFLQCEAKIVRRHNCRQRFGVVSRQRLRPKRFDSTVIRVPKLKFEPVSFLFLVRL